VLLILKRKRFRERKNRKSNNNKIINIMRAIINNSSIISMVEMIITMTRTIIKINIINTINNRTTIIINRNKTIISQEIYGMIMLRMLSKIINIKITMPQKEVGRERK
jgi:hypothetical protein